ncbi:MAG: magnesium/cobalt transporter CorA [Pseudomonadota bacterium]|nr:magnesium/cobalt transporter CorA [Pseudomonadota bacterium]
MIRTLLINPKTGETTEGNWSSVQRWKEQPEWLIWVDLDEIRSEGEAKQLTEYFGIHPLAIQDAQRERHPPKLEDFDDHLFVLLKGLNTNTDSIDFATIQIALFVGERFLVTRHTGRSTSIDTLWKNCRDHTAPEFRNAMQLAAKISRLIIDRYLAILFNLEMRLESIEEDMTDNPTDELLLELRSHRANLKKLMRILLYQTHIFQEMKSDDGDARLSRYTHELTDVYEQTERAHSLARLYDELAADMIEGYLSLASHRMNQVMKILTIITAIFVPLSFMAGLYGMNFEYIPELHARNGYFVLLGVMAAVVVILLTIFRRKNWL